MVCRYGWQPFCISICGSEGPIHMTTKLPNLSCLGFSPLLDSSQLCTYLQCELACGLKTPEPFTTGFHIFAEGINWGWWWKPLSKITTKSAFSYEIKEWPHGSFLEITTLENSNMTGLYHSACTCAIMVD